MKRYVYKKKIWIVLATLVDFLGFTVSLPFRFMPRRGINKIERALIIRCDHLGDIINSTPVVKALEKHKPDLKVDFLTSSLGKEVLRNSAYLKNVYSFDAPWFSRRKMPLTTHIKGIMEMVNIIKNGNYDIVFDLRGDMRHILSIFMAGVRSRVSYGITGGGFLLTHTVGYEWKIHEIKRNMALLKVVGINSLDIKPSIPTRGDDAKKADELLKYNGIKEGFVVFHPFPSRKEKEWPYSKFAGLIDYMTLKKPLAAVIIGSRNDWGKIESYLKNNGKIANLTGETSIPVLYHLILRANMFIGVDSGPAHVAASSGKPTVVLFSGINDPREWAPLGDNVNLVYPGEGKDLSSMDTPDVLNIIDRIL